MDKSSTSLAKKKKEKEKNSYDTLHTVKELYFLPKKKKGKRNILYKYFFKNEMLYVMKHKTDALQI